MNIAFRQLFSIRVDHAFHAGAPDDVAFAISSETQRALARARLRPRHQAGVLEIWYECTETDIPVVRLDSVTLRFGLRVRSPHFSNYTVLPAEFPDRRLYFHNHTASTALAADQPVRLLPALFSHAPSLATRPVTVSLRDAEGVIIASDTLSASDTRSVVPFDLRAVRAGALELTEQYPATTRTEVCYFEREYGARDVAGIVEVVVAETFYDAPPAFVVPFSTRSETLQYYVVARNYTQQHFNQLNVRDEGFAEENRPQVQFQRINSSSFTANELPLEVLASSPEQRVALFRSTAPVPRTERARRRIQLLRQNEVLIENLPQPSASTAQAELVIHLSRP